GLGAEFHLLDLDDPLLLPRFLRLLVDLVPVLAVVQDAADGRVGLRRDLDQIQPGLDRESQRLLGRHDAQLPAVGADHPDFPAPDLTVDPQFLLDGSSPVQGPRVRPLCMPTMSPRTASSVIGPRSPSLRLRTATNPAWDSRSPATSIYGTL